MKVYVVQRPVYRNRDASVGFDDVPQWIDKYDLTPATEFGRLVDVLPVGRTPSNVGELARALERGLEQFDAGDSLLLVGDPIAIGLALKYASRRCDPVRVLKWDRRDSRYRAELLPA